MAMEILWGMQNGKYPLNTPQEEALFLYYQKKLNLIAPEHRSIVARLAGLYRQEPENLILLLLLIREDDSYRDFPGQAAVCHGADLPGWAARVRSCIWKRIRS